MVLTSRASPGALDWEAFGLDWVRYMGGFYLSHGLEDKGPGMGPG